MFAVTSSRISTFWNASRRKRRSAGRMLQGSINRRIDDLHQGR